MTTHIRPTAELAERALLPEDPGSAMALAQVLLERPLMFNHNCGLWGYTGVAADGLPLTVQSTGLGGPSAAIVVSELIALGLRRAIRVGTCGALAGGLELGELIVAESALAADGTSRALGAGERAGGDAVLSAGLRSAAPELRHGLVASTDLFYGPAVDGRRVGSDDVAPWRAAGALALDMESAAVFALGARRGVAIACVLTVTALLSPDAPAAGIDDEGVAAAAGRAGRLALRALAPPGPPGR